LKRDGRIKLPGIMYSTGYDHKGVQQGGHKNYQVPTLTKVPITTLSHEDPL